jgi:N-hydroxyarylamine O-acetyltransferase
VAFVGELPLLDMDINRYLRRIDYQGEKRIDEATLKLLHEQHVRQVPFENLDVHLKRLFDLKLSNIYKKVVVHNRGGFCYELNALFCWLLCKIGFESRIIAARIFDDQGNLGPNYDHMSVYIDIGKKYLADVGFGDLFVQPLEIRDGIQSDGRNLFKIEKVDEQDFVLSMGSEQSDFQKKYIFSLKKVRISSFHQICLDKQTNPKSYFVKNTVCTKPTKSGRLTLFNDRIIEKRGKDRFEKLINSESELKVALKTLFGIDLA